MAYGSIDREELRRRGLTKDAMAFQYEVIERALEEELITLKCVRSFLKQEAMETADIVAAAHYIARHPEIVQLRPGVEATLEPSSGMPASSSPKTEAEG